MSGGKVNDDVVKSSFFRRVHLTGLWMEARYPATPAYGIVGMQINQVLVRGKYGTQAERSASWTVRCSWLRSISIDVAIAAGSRA
jgi:hypothetical protein